MKWTVGIITMLFCVIFLSGCSNNSDKTDYYGGIKKTDFPDLDIVQEFRGHGDYWGVVMFVYKDSSTKLGFTSFAIYNGEGEKPTSIALDYEIGKNVGGWSSTYSDGPPEDGIYHLVGGNIELPKDGSDPTLKFNVKSNIHSEFIELKAVD
ncbi:hypothetical protein [Paenibacillus sp. MMO-58]|uniref:hypothetical protein n=1 Tax=Paenibacillus sp. MMO-58 TaxID=3081290 RepID=UPI0030174CB3